ncbi:MAG: hypothetical protein PWP70_1469 [Moorella sp. (in: firmicutes)]|nr:hypothetical protein [Moorella sp. (in: firmicutes)]
MGIDFWMVFFVKARWTRAFFIFVILLPGVEHTKGEAGLFLHKGQVRFRPYLLNSSRGEIKHMTGQGRERDLERGRTAP